MTDRVEFWLTIEKKMTTSQIKDFCAQRNEKYWIDKKCGSITFKTNHDNHLHDFILDMQDFIRHLPELERLLILN